MKTCKDYMPHDAGYLPLECCGSCHTDADEFGYELMTGTDKDRHDYEVCCSIRGIIENQKGKL